MPTSGAGPDEGHGEAQLFGVLGGETADGTVCFTVEPPDGPGRLLVVWPEGYTALDDPLRVVDGTGEVVATAGDEVELVGGTASAEEGDIGCGGVSAPGWRAGGVVSAG
ncbi:hypothetical protein CQJ94_24275 [Glycomyces fuscus]|nr:hypothetical protein CQJ94_24275 [Glycomyces fuscus]